MTDTQYYRDITTQKRVATLLRSEIERATNQFFFERGFIYVDPPILHEVVPGKEREIYVSICEKKYALAGSNALYMSAYAAEFNKVFTVSKCFRDENEQENHLLEFSILEVEILDCALLEMLVVIEDYLRFILQQVLKSGWIENYFDFRSRILLLRENFDVKIIPYDQFSSNVLAENRYIDISDMDYLKIKRPKNVMIIVDYPTHCARWTSMIKGNGSSLAMNVILPELYGELCEGCQRSNDVLILQHKINMANAGSIQWYVDAIKKIKTNRCSFGLGMERLVRWLLGAKTISDTKFFPRVKENENG